MKNIDIFCEVIDNYGDIGVVYRLGKGLKNKEYNIRIFLNRLDELAEMNKKIDKKKIIQEVEGITYINKKIINKESIKEIGTADVVIEAFATEPDAEYIEYASLKKTLLINLEYLSAESWVEDYHLMESLTGKENIKKYFFMQGFSEKTGGVVIEDNFLNLKKIVKTENEKSKKLYLIKEILEMKKIKLNLDNKILGTVFTYEYNFKIMIDVLKKINKNYILFLFGEKTKNSFKKNLEIEENEKILTYSLDKIEFVFMPFLNQEEYDLFLLNSNFNIVRGEESFVRAILSEKPFVWQSYRQEELLHLEKVKAFLNIYKKYFKNEEDYSKIDNIFYEFNKRENDSFEIDLNYDAFYNFFSEIEKFSFSVEKLSIYLETKCDIVKKMDDFIKIFFNLPNLG